MAKVIQRRRGTTAEHGSFTGALAELTIDTTKKTVVVHDGAAVGGVPLAREDFANTNTTALPTINGSGTAADDMFLVYDTSAGLMKAITRTELNNAIEADALETVNITGGTINGTTIGATTASTGAFTNLSYTGTLTGSTGILNIGSGQIYKDASGNVGIGTSTPQSELTVRGSTPQITLEPTSDTQDSRIQFAATDGTIRSSIRGGGSFGQDIVFINAAERLRITSTGNVGIGTSSPDGKLHVQNGSAGTVTAWGNADDLVVETSGATGLSILAPDNNQSNLIFGSPSDNIGAIVRWVHDDSELQFGSHKSDGFVTFKTAIGVERMRITSAGDVGIGTTTPQDELHISKTSGTVGILATRLVTSPSYARLVAATNTALLQGGPVLSFHISNADGTSPVERMRIDSAGNVGIGTSSPEEVLHIAADANSAIRLGRAGSDFAYKLRANVSAVVNGGFEIEDAVTGANLYQVFSKSTGRHVFYIDGSEKARIASNGNVGIGTNSPSERLDVANTGNGARVRVTNSDRVKSAAVALVEFAGSDGRNGFIGANNNLVNLLAESTANGINFTTGGSERMRIDALGNVLVGTTTNDAAVTGIQIRPTSIVATNSDTVFFGRRTGSNGNLFEFRRDVTLVGTISVTTTATSYNTSSTSGITGVDANTVAIRTNSAERMRIDSSGNVGIGTSNPDGTLVLSAGSQGAASTGGYLGLTTGTNNSKVRGAGIESFSVGTGNDHGLRFFTNASAASPAERMRIDSSGNVGIGTSSPTEKLEVAGNVILDANNASLKLKSGITGTHGKIQWTFNTDSSEFASIGINYDLRATQGLLIDSGYPITLDAPTSIHFRTNNAERMRIDSAGNVGIGTSSPYGIGDHKVLTVRGASATSGGMIALQTSGNEYVSRLYTADNGLTLESNTGPNIVFRNNGSERARIDSSGNLLVGTTDNSPRNFNTAINGVAIKGNVGAHEFASSDVTSCFVNNTNSASSSATFITFRQRGTLRGEITTNGSTTTYATSSDYRLKTLVGNVTDSGTRIDLLNPVEFDWVANGQRDRGFFADQFQQVYPNSVTGQKDEVDKEGNPVYQSMQASSSEVIADLVAEIQSLRIRVAQLEGN